MILISKFSSVTFNVIVADQPGQLVVDWWWWWWLVPLLCKMMVICGTFGVLWRIDDWIWVLWRMDDSHLLENRNPQELLDCPGGWSLINLKQVTIIEGRWQPRRQWWQWWWRWWPGILARTHHTAGQNNQRDTGRSPGSERRQLLNLNSQGPHLI